MQTPIVSSAAGPDVSSNTGRKLRVLVVDDSLVIRRFLTRALAEDASFEVVGFAANGALALLQEAQLHPDVITMDIEMPQMDGLATVSALRSRGSKAVIIMCSTLTTAGGASTIEALMRGANDYVTKPFGNDSMETALEGMRLELVPKIRQFFYRELNARPPARVAATGRQGTGRPATGGPMTGYAPGHSVSHGQGTQLSIASDRTSKPPSSYPSPGTLAAPSDIVAIGVSTGGPTALLKLLPSLPAQFPVPIVIVQHMPPIFTRQLAERLNSESAIEVLEAEEGMSLAAGQALLAPGDFHLRLKRTMHEVRVTLDRGERENSCRPAVDVLFRSIREVYGGRALAVILTGMGQDGLRGAEELKGVGACVLAQDRASSVVWGMPGAVIEAGLADDVLSLNEVAPAMLRRVRKV